MWGPEYTQLRPSEIISLCTFHVRKIALSQKIQSHENYVILLMLYTSICMVARSLVLVVGSLKFVNFLLNSALQIIISPGWIESYKYFSVLNYYVRMYVY